MSMAHESCRKTSTRFRVGHLDPLDFVAVKCSNWDETNVVLFTTNHNQKLFLSQIVDLVDTFTLAHSSDFCRNEAMIQ